MQTTMSKAEAITIVKAINRHVKRHRLMSGGRTFGVDFPTWNVCYPHLAKAFREAGRVIAGRDGLFMPQFP